MIAESSDALQESQTSSQTQPFSPDLSDSETQVDLLQRSVSQQTEQNMTLDQLNLLKYNCKCACHLFRNGQLSDELPCQGTVVYNTAFRLYLLCIANMSLFHPFFVIYLSIL